MHMEGFPQSEWQVGKSKIFLRGCVHEPLEEKRQKVLNSMAVRIQKTWKGQKQRKRFVPWQFKKDCISLFFLGVSITILVTIAVL